MSHTNPILQSIRDSAGMRLAVLFGSFFIFLLFVSIVNIGINTLPIDSRSQMLLSSVLQCILAFCLPALILAKFSSNNWKSWLDLTTPPGLKAILGVLCIYLISLPAMEWLIEWNSNLHLPESMASLENTLRHWEETNEAASQLLLDAHGFVPVLAGVLVIGILTGFSEELFFRGGLQGIFSKTSIGIGVSVWLAAFIFSAMHFQFFGFLPRLIMGVFFGYLLVWTKSIWVPVFAHALNNSVVVIMSSITGDPSYQLIDSTIQSNFWGSNSSVILSVFLTAIFLFIFKDNVFKTNKSSWQRKQRPSVSEN